MQKGRRFNCAEQVFTNANDILKIPNFSEKFLKIASGFGGGVSGKGSICGAASGGIMALGLKYGTDGSEIKEIFDIKRKELRNIALNFMKEFENKFGSIECRNLLGFEVNTEEGRKRYKELKRKNKLRCQDYIKFSSKFICKLLE